MLYIGSQVLLVGSAALGFLVQRHGRNAMQSLPTVHFDENIVHLLDAAHVEAFEAGYAAIGTEHILLALLRPESGISAGLLEKAGMNADNVRATVRARMPRGRRQPDINVQLPFTNRAAKAIAFALKSAARQGLTTAGSGHLLLGVLSDEKSLAWALLKERGVTMAGIQQQLPLQLSK